MYLAVYICSQPNKISIFWFVGKDKMLQNKTICCGFWVQVHSPSKFDYSRQLNRKFYLDLKFTPCLLFWRLTHSAFIQTQTLFWSVWVLQMHWDLLKHSFIFLAMFGFVQVKNLTCRMLQDRHGRLFVAVWQTLRSEYCLRQSDNPKVEWEIL